MRERRCWRTISRRNVVYEGTARYLQCKIVALRKSILGTYSEYLSRSGLFVDVLPNGAYFKIWWGVISGVLYKRCEGNDAQLTGPRDVGENRTLGHENREYGCECSGSLSV